jgi:hypothetical protein
MIGERVESIVPFLQSQQICLIGGVLFVNTMQSCPIGTAGTPDNAMNDPPIHQNNALPKDFARA